jgi:hypothetical protein
MQRLSTFCIALFMFCLCIRVGRRAVFNYLAFNSFMSCTYGKVLKHTYTHTYYTSVFKGGYFKISVTKTSVSFIVISQLSLLHEFS